MYSTPKISPKAPRFLFPIQKSEADLWKKIGHWQEPSSEPRLINKQPAKQKEYAMKGDRSPATGPEIQVELPSWSLKRILLRSLDQRRRLDKGEKRGTTRTEETEKTLSTTRRKRNERGTPVAARPESQSFREGNKGNKVDYSWEKSCRNARPEIERDQDKFL